MPFLIHPVSNTELHRASTIEAAAYASNPLNPLLFPGPFPPDALQKRVDSLIRMRQEDSTAVYTQAIDSVSRRMVAFAKWHVYGTHEACLLPARALEFGPGTSPEACRMFFGGLVQRKSELVGGRPHVCMSAPGRGVAPVHLLTGGPDLHMLHTDPAFQRQGAGSALLGCVKRKADELGLPIYLESSAAAHAFYRRHGFEDVEVLFLDFSKFGGMERYEQPLMIREPSGAQ
ncbi:N-acetyltransferase [Ascochyta rabiei]|uniref:N-acetyltransferase n=1 Tax=Didymella rabiei TaxID=5454 RepID=A0A163BM97_DIDRA|nr:N-acetyltransferase [Ascochyta rabiei]